MCGIVGYVGKREAYPVIMKGLKRLEYRGYDSAGIALLNSELNIYKRKGRVTDLEESLVGADVSGGTGIGHTRWATHGEPSDYNAHPHRSSDGRLAMIHNGIIENYALLKQELLKKGYAFISDTDTEVLLYFIEDIRKENRCTTEEALYVALRRVVGAYCILLIDKEVPDTIIAARKGSPLVIGIGKEEHYLASDASPMIEYTKEVVYVNDYQVAIVKPGELTLKNLGSEKQSLFIEKLDMDLTAVEKGGFDHFMLKEIHDQPSSLHDCLRGRLHTGLDTITLSGVEDFLSFFTQANRIILVGCGTSWHAGLVAEYLFEELCRIPVEVEYASEFRYRNPVIGNGDVIIALSQSGETADTLVALENASKQGAFIFGIVNAVGSSIARLSDAGVYTHSGPEIGVASTKAYTGQLAVLLLIACKIGYAKGTLDPHKYRLLLAQLDAIPKLVEEVLEKVVSSVQVIAETYHRAENFLFLGRGINFPTALEGALKLKEISYIHAEGYPAAEMKHGPIALVDENLPVVFIATKGAAYGKLVSNIQEIKARKGKIIALVTSNDDIVSQLADHVIRVPETDELLSPLLNVIPLQLLSYYIGVAKGFDVDKPRNLAKSVTVE